MSQVTRWRCSRLDCGFVSCVKTAWQGRSLEFIPGVRDIVVYTKNELKARKALADAQLIFCLDYNSLKRVDRLAEFIEPLKVPRVLIDHHLDPDSIFDIAISHPDASSTCELVFRVFMQMGKLFVCGSHNRYRWLCL